MFNKVFPDDSTALVSQEIKVIKLVYIGRKVSTEQTKSILGPLQWCQH